MRGSVIMWLLLLNPAAVSSGTRDGGGCFLLVVFGRDFLFAAAALVISSCFFVGFGAA